MTWQEMLDVFATLGLEKDQYIANPSLVSFVEKVAVRVESISFSNGGLRSSQVVALAMSTWEHLNPSLPIAVRRDR